MVDKVNGMAYGGEWVTGDLRFLIVTAPGATFLADAPTYDADGALEKKDTLPTSTDKVYQILATRSTPVIMSADSETVLHVAVDLAAGDFSTEDTTVVDELVALLETAGFAGATVVEGKFAVA